MYGHLSCPCLIAFRVHNHFVWVCARRGGGGGLHNMRWDPDNIRHVESVVQLYSVLLQQPEGVHFLQSDARGGILQVLVVSR